MGLTYLTATVQSLDPAAAPKEATLLVDTGAIDCLLPASFMTDAGIKPDGVDVYETADGRSLELPFGWARFDFMGTFVFAKTVFGPEGSEPLIGAIALEAAGIVIDPRTQALKRLSARSFKRAAVAAYLDPTSPL